MSEPEPPQGKWSTYYSATQGRPVRDVCRRAHLAFEQLNGGNRLAVDLGCGSGVESRYLLEQGWRVLAVDEQAEAIEALCATVSVGSCERLSTQIAKFEDLELPTADLIWAGNSLPFCPAAKFPDLWSKLVASLKPGGRLAVELFGERHAWRISPGITVQTREDVERLCQDLEFEYLDEVDADRMTFSSGIQHWHAYRLIARRP